MSLYYKKDDQLHRVGIVINSGEAAGHTIESSDGTDMAAQPNLQFADAHVTNDTTNDRTKVEVTKSISESDFDDLDETDSANEGLYEVDSSDTVLLTDDMIAHDATHTVREVINGLEEGLVWENVTNLITSKNSAIGSFSAYKCGKIVRVFAATTSTVLNNVTELFELPASLTPAFTNYFIGFSYSHSGSDLKIGTIRATSDTRKCYVCNTLAETMTYINVDVSIPII